MAMEGDGKGPGSTDAVENGASRPVEGETRESSSDSEPLLRLTEVVRRVRESLRNAEGKPKEGETVRDPQSLRDELAKDGEFLKRFSELLDTVRKNPSLTEKFQSALRELDNRTISRRKSQSHHRSSQ